jgi:hypothetical protein
LFAGHGFLFGKITFAEMTVSENVGYSVIFGSLGLATLLWRHPDPSTDPWQSSPSVSFSFASIGILGGTFLFSAAYSAAPR